MVVDDDGREVADGVPGELLTRGPYTIRGYYNAPDKNREAFTADGFYRMGDIVRKRGRHVFTEGRRKDLINRGGEKISCEEVENLIYAHPKVKVVTLVAMPDPVFGEKACAFVVPKPGETLAFDELIAFLRQQKIATFKLPERLEVVAELPLSPVGKILKRELREMITAKLAREGPRAGRAREHRHRRRRPRRTLLRVPHEAARCRPPHPDRRARSRGRDLRLGRGVHRHRAGVRPRRRA